MHVFIQRLNGNTQVVELAESETAGMLMARVGCQRLVSGARVLCAQDRLANNQTVFEVLPLAGGKNKKSKKVDTSKPKHKKHQNKKVKLAVLSYYRVSEDGKVDRLRKPCDNPKCGPCSFLAQHQDRFTCGKCHKSKQRAAL